MPFKFGRLLSLDVAIHFVIVVFRKSCWWQEYMLLLISICVVSVRCALILRPQLFFVYIIKFCFTGCIVFLTWVTWTGYSKSLSFFSRSSLSKSRYKDFDKVLEKVIENCFISNYIYPHPILSSYIWCWSKILKNSDIWLFNSLNF